jgi:hypothetical protein
MFGLDEATRVLQDLASELNAHQSARKTAHRTPLMDMSHFGGHEPRAAGPVDGNPFALGPW